MPRSDQYRDRALAGARLCAGVTDIEEALYALLDQHARHTMEMLMEDVDSSFVSQLARESATEFCRTRKEIE